MSSNSRSTARNKVNNDPVDELKRRSRRRLVGSIALFLAAIIIVPALVENEPARTSSEIELVVPERPSTDTPTEVAKLPSKPPVETTRQEKIEPAVVPPAVTPPAVIPPLEIDPKPEPRVEAKPEPKPEPRVEAKPEPKPEQKAQPKPEPKPEPKAESKPAEDPIAAFAKPEAKPESRSESKTTETFWVQVAAVGDKARADALSRELGGKGFQSRVEATSGQAGTVYRVRVGPISGQAKADETKARLAGAGYTAARVVQ
ncbi:MAG TPA: SPOR domain-containing protein [Limnobacter sp.]|nr:SPOR domain-containing protein [Limnobacter sp.]